MPHELDTILISSSQSDFDNRIDTLHKELLRAARFGGFDEDSATNRQKVFDIIRDVDNPNDEDVDQAVSRLTKRMKMAPATNVPAPNNPMQAIRMVSPVKVRKIRIRRLS